MNSIEVLLATYRPDPDRLKKQVDSIHAQKGVAVRLTVREDQNGDGALANFSALLEQAVSGDEPRYVAFSDQDDVWHEDKLAKCMAKMQEMEAKWGSDTPILAFSDAVVVDGDLHTLDESLFHRTHRDPHRLLPRQLLLQNVPNGNTMLLNAALARKSSPIPPDAVMHDHWVALVASAFGRIAFVDEALLLYRQHGHNVFGGAKVGIAYYFAKMRQGRRELRRLIHGYIRQAAAFSRRYPDAPECFRICDGLLRRNWFVRRWLLLRYGVLKAGIMRNLGMLAVV